MITIDLYIFIFIHILFFFLFFFFLFTYNVVSKTEGSVYCTWHHSPFDKETQHYIMNYEHTAITMCTL